jgi:factor associated with neutral sphingomyelinase activation
MLDGKYRQRFSQLLLEDQEVYTNKFLVLLNDKKQGFCHVTSKSVVLEPFNTESPVIQYFYRDMCNIPRLDTDFPGSLIFSICSFKILPDVFHTSQIKTKPIHQISFCPLHESPKSVLETILIYYIKGKNNNWLINSKELIESFKSRNKFDYNQILSIREQHVTREAIFCFQVTPLEASQGWMMITEQRVYFQHIFPVIKSPLLIIDNTKISRINKRKLIFQNIGLEIFTEKKSFLFRFPTEKTRDLVFAGLSKALPEISSNEEILDEMTTKWQQRLITNYEYLLYLNQMANRTFNDFSQYPIFPWVLSNYSSTSLDLNDSSNYRDLSKPIGWLSPKKFSFLKSQSFDDSKLLYMSHYSFPAMITRWLIRKFPVFIWSQQVFSK